jgi:hypothetical protein
MLAQVDDTVERSAMRCSRTECFTVKPTKMTTEAVNDRTWLFDYDFEVL